MMERDHIHRRIVIEYGCVYAYCYITDGNGKVMDEESFKQPYRMDRPDVAEEAKELYDLVWEHLNETVNVMPLQDMGGDEPESEDEED